jgi:hypothetical protein
MMMKCLHIDHLMNQIISERINVRIVERGNNHQKEAGNDSVKSVLKTFLINKEKQTTKPYLSFIGLFLLQSNNLLSKKPDK